MIFPTSVNITDFKGSEISFPFLAGLGVTGSKKCLCRKSSFSPSCRGLAELLPVSSSAHVVVAEKLMGLDPSSPPMTLLLVMLQTGTMFAVIVFWRQWRTTYFLDAAAFKSVAVNIVVATALTGLAGEPIIKIIEKTAFGGAKDPQIEDLFSQLEIIAPALAAGRRAHSDRRYRSDAQCGCIEAETFETGRWPGCPDWGRARSLSSFPRVFPLLW